jgi:hypothetical protein
MVDLLTAGRSSEVFVKEAMGNDLPLTFHANLELKAPVAKVRAGSDPLPAPATANFYTL